MPGPGTPMLPGRSMGKCTMVTAGAVSVSPQEEMNGTLLPRTFMPSASSRSHRLCGSAAAA